MKSWRLGQKKSSSAPYTHYCQIRQVASQYTRRNWQFCKYVDALSGGGLENELQSRERLGTEDSDKGFFRSRGSLFKAHI